MAQQGTEPVSGKSAAEIHGWLVTAVSSRVGLDPRVLDPRERFSRYGIDSMKAAGVTADLSAFLGKPLARTLLWDYPSIEAVVRHLTAAAASTAPGTVPPATAQTTSDEPIAIVGLACRFPMAPDPAAFWRLLIDGTDAIREVPQERWDIDRFYNADLAAPGRMTTRWGGFLDGVDRFDPQFFGISPREAVQMDPQQRIVLELAWEAFEDAGIIADRLRDSRTGVFLGAMWSDYARLIAGSPSCITQHTATGQDTSIIPARVSYTFGLQGPSIAVNTACSSSLVAVHLACQALRNNEATLALAGGVNLVLSPESTVAMSKFGAMAPDGRSKAFDARANGYVRGEGAGLLVLKPLSHALRDGDRIYCVVLGAATNNDGFSNGLTAPNPQAQEDMLRLAYGRVGVAPEDVDYIETHGTGTLLGDPIEAGAIGRVFGPGRSAGTPLLIGSVKTNIGHLEAAAGIAGLIKVALAMRHRRIPRTLHFETPNPNIDFDAMHLAVQHRVTAWPSVDRAAIAGVSSFGFGGTNCHVVLRQWQRTPGFVLPLAAASADLLQAAARDLRDRVSADASIADVRELCLSAAALVGDAPYRLAFNVRSASELGSQLETALAGQQTPGVASGVANQPAGRLVWVFSPHGGQWIGMGRQLLAQEPVFRAALERCAAAIRREAGWELLDELLADEPHSRLNDVAITQPAIFSIQVALAALWRSWGVQPDAVIGHSMGEVAAAHVGGALTLDDAAKVICHRSRLLARTAGKGALAIIGLSADATAAALTGRGDRLWTVAFNSPVSTLVSGEPDVLATLLSDLERDGVFCRRVRVDVAAHSPHMDPLLDELLDAVRDVRPLRGSATVYSTVDGRVRAGEAFDASYWGRNLRQPVLFAQAIAELLAAGPATFLELGPHPVLAPALQQCLGREDRPVVESLRRGEDERGALLDAAARLYVSGAASPDWRAAAGRIGEAASGAPGEDATPASTARHLLVLSAHSQDALKDRIEDIGEFVGQSADLSLHDLCYTAAARRSPQAHRFASVAGTRLEMIEHLAAFRGGEQRAGTSTGERAMSGPGRIAFVFPGQGCQWIGMGRQLLESEPVFRAAIVRCDAIIDRISGWSLLEELNAPAGRSHLTDRIDIIQPSLFAMQVALAALWRSWGIEPGAVVGHSMGEVAAAHVAGVLSLEDAAAIICRRSLLLRRVSGQGAMAVVELSLEDAARALDGYQDKLSVAASNSPRSTVLSGDPVALAAVIAELERRGVFCRHVKVDVASHSPQMDPLREELLQILAGVAPQAGSLPVYSTVAASPIDGSAFTAEYWARNLREPVLFSSAVSRLIADGYDTFLEISAHPLLLPSVEELLEFSGGRGVVLPSLRRDEHERGVMLGSLGAMFCHGHAVPWEHVYPDSGRVVTLPPYAWQRQQYWIERHEGDALQERAARRDPDTHPVMGRPVRPAGLGVAVWEFDIAAGQLRTSEGVTADRLSAFDLLHLAQAGAAEAIAGAFKLGQVACGASIELPAGSAQTIQIVVAPARTGRMRLTILSRGSANADALWKVGLTATVEPIEAEPVVQFEGGLPPKQTDGWEPIEGPSPAVDQAFRSPRGIVARFPAGAQQTSSGMSRFGVDPALLEAACALIAAPESRAGEAPRRALVGVDEVRFFNRDDVAWCHAPAPGAVAASTSRLDLQLFGASGELVADFKGMEISGEPDGAVDRLFYEIAWEAEPAALAGDPNARRHWLILCDAGGIGERVAASLETAGDRCVRVPFGSDREDGSLEAMLAGESALRGRAFHGVVDIASIDLPRGDRLDVTEVEAAIERGSLGGLHLVQALTRLDAAPPRLYFVTRGAQPVARRFVTSVMQAPLWGLASAVAVEHPEFRCTRIDLADDGGTEQVDALASELRANSPDDLIAFRGGRRFVAHLSRTAVPLAATRASDGRDHADAGDPRPFEIDIAAASWRLFPASNCCAGRVTGVGADVQAFRAGDDVVALCGDTMGENVRVDTRRVALRPDGFDVETASLPRLTELFPALASDDERFPGTVLITGGFGGLGLVTAAWMVERGARHLVLVGRRPPSESAQKAIDEMTRGGAAIVAVAADVTSESDLARVIGDIDRTMPPLRGIVHAAGVLDDGVVSTLDAVKFWNVLGPKVRGAWLLHQLTADRPLDFFVLYSSVLSYLGAGGQANHATANAFLDALADYRRSQGRAALSINWGPWSEVGLAAARGGRGDRLESMGLGSLNPSEGRVTLERVFRHDAAQISVMRFDARQWCASASNVAGTTLFASLVAQAAASAVEGAESAPERSVRERFVAAAAGVERRGAIETYLQESVARVLRLSPSAIDPEKPVRAMGLDSLMAIELRKRLEAGTGVPIPTTLIWNYPTIRRLAPEIASRMGLALEIEAEVATGAAGPATTARLDPPAGEDLEALFGALESLTNDEARSLLDDESVTERAANG